MHLNLYTLNSIVYIQHKQMNQNIIKKKKKKNVLISLSLSATSSNILYKFGIKCRIIFISCDIMQHNTIQNVQCFTYFTYFFSYMTVFYIPFRTQPKSLWFQEQHKSCEKRNKKKTHYGCARPPQAYLIDVHKPSVSARTFNHVFSAATL